MMTNCSEYCVLVEEVWIPAAYRHTHIAYRHTHIAYRQTHTHIAYRHTHIAYRHTHTHTLQLTTDVLAFVCTVIKCNIY